MLVSYENVEIYEQQLVVVDKHITACTICTEDAEHIKRSRVLFNLGALITAPHIIDKMVSNAMASEFSYLSNTVSASKASCHTVLQSSNTSELKLLSSKATLKEVLPQIPMLKKWPNQIKLSYQRSTFAEKKPVHMNLNR